MEHRAGGRWSALGPGLRLALRLLLLPPALLSSEYQIYIPIFEGNKACWWHGGVVAHGNLWLTPPGHSLFVRPRPATGTVLSRSLRAAPPLRIYF